MGHIDADAAGLLMLAAHEVGHAVVCQAHGIDVEWVKLTDTAGQVSHADIDLDDVEEVNAGLMVYLAGQEAAALYLTRHRGYGHRAALRLAAEGSVSDLAYFRRMKRYGSLSESVLRRRTRSIVTSNFGRIERLAGRLVRDGRLSGGHFS